MVTLGVPFRRIHLRHILGGSVFDASTNHVRRLDSSGRARRGSAIAPHPFALVRPSGVRAVRVPATTAWFVALLVALVSVMALSMGSGSPSDTSALSGAGAKPVKTPKPTPSPTPAPTASPCFTSGPSSAYSVTVCITLPASGAVLTGSTTVTGTVTSTDATIGVQRAIFTMDGAPLLTDYTSPYTFTLDTRRWVDGTHQIWLAALMRDGFTTQTATLPVTFSNGITNPPVNNGSFTPATGTTPAPGAPLVLAAAGDGAGGEPGETSTVGLISSWNPNMFLYLGDVYESGQPMEFDNWYGPQGATGTYGQFRNITNPTVGNYEYTGGLAPGYFWYWNNIPNYYSFNAGGWHIISLNSTSQYGGTATNSAQYQWLQGDLAANASKACTIVYYHHPLYNTGPEGSTTSLQPIWQLLAQNKVTMVLNGHDHSYQRFSPIDGSGAVSATGVTEFIVGSGGHGHQGLTTPDPKLAAADYTNFGALKLSLYGTSAAFQFVTTTGAVTDSGLIPCKNTVDTQAPTAPPTFGATSPSPSQIDLSWGGSTDNIGIAGYEIFRDGNWTTPIVTLAPDARSYSDTPLAPSSTHTYTIKAFDAAGNRSDPTGPITQSTSNGVVTQTFNPVADSYVSSSTPTTNYGTSTTLRVQSGSAALTSYLRFDLSGVLGQIQDARLLVYSNSTGPAGFDVFGVASTTWGETTINYNNAPPIGSPTGISSGPITTGSWSSVNVTTLASAAHGGLFSLALGPSASTQRSFASRESAFAPQLILTVGAGNSGPPTASFTASTSTVTAGLPVSFTDTSTDGATGWNWSFGDTVTSTAQNPSHAWAAPGTYTVTLIATNAYGSSAPATTQIDVVVDTVAPSTPGSLTATPVNSTRIDMAWTASTDNVGVTGYRVYRNGNATPIALLSSATLGYQDGAVAPGTSYDYTVDAVDAAGNASVAAGPASATTPSGSVTLTRNPLADAYVDSVNSATNYGTNTSIRVSGPSQIRNSYLKFDLSGISSSFSSATLRVYCISGCSSTGAAARAVMDSTWGEGSITYANAPAFSSSIAGSSGALVVGWNTIDVSSIVSAGAGSVTSMVLTTTGSQINLSSKEGSFVPELVVVLGGP